MNPESHIVEFEGKTLRRGFWLYVCDIETPNGDQLLYVGRTGDNSTPNAQSAFVRMGQNLGKAKNSSMIRNYLGMRELEPEDCNFKFVTYGPVLDEAPEKDMEEHKIRRNKIGAMEKALAEDLRKANYEVVNPINCSWPLDQDLYAQVHRAFAAHFPDLRAET